jgi:hypothetical protein
MKRHWSLAVSLLMALSTGSPAAEIETRGVGVYPGDPREDFAPELVPDTTYRNIALRRPASVGAYDYNLTAQLVTDGVRRRLCRGRDHEHGRSPRAQREPRGPQPTSAGHRRKRPMQFAFAVATSRSTARSRDVPRRPPRGGRRAGRVPGG